MAKQGFIKFFLPSEIPNRKAAAAAVAAGIIAGFIFVFLVGGVSVILLIRDGSTPMSLGFSLAAIVMIMVMIGTWKRVLAAPIVGLVLTGASLIWAITHGHFSAILLVIPVIGGFWTARRGIAVLNDLRDNDSSATVEK